MLNSLLIDHIYCRGLNKEDYTALFPTISGYCPTKPYDVATQNNRLIEVILLRNPLCRARG